MAKKPQVDIRKLKDEVAGSLKKQKWDRAADLLEQLVLAEPKDMSHRLKLGDAYRHLEEPAKAIGCYQHAASFFGDQGQVIKAIGAVKIILEIDPRNVEALARLKKMNQQRGSKESPVAIGLRKPAPAATGQRAVPLAAIELEPYPSSSAGEDEPLELDDGHAGQPPASLPQRGFNPSAPRRVLVPPPPDLPDEPDLGPPGSAPPRRRSKLEKGVEPEELPDEAILAPPEPEDLIPSEDDEEVLPDEEGPWASAEQDEPEDEEIRPAAAPPPSIPLPKRKAKKPQDEEEEIVLDDTPEPSRRKPARAPIAELLSSAAEEEVELLSISSEEERPGPSTEELVSDADLLDHAFDKVAGAPGATRKLPTNKVPLFDDLSQSAFVELVNKLNYQRHPPGQLIIREGDPGHSFFIIIEGKVRIFKLGPDEREITLAHLGEGAFFGEMALLSGAPRTANVVAEEDTELLEVTDTVLRDMARKHPQVLRSLKNFYRQRLLNNVMAISPLFKDFDPAERKSIVEKFRMKQAGDGEVLISEESDSDGLYVVLHGAVQVSKRVGAAPVELARLKEGAIFGEMSLLTRQPAAATVTSLGNSILLRLPREGFQELAVTHPQILELVSQLSEQRRRAIDGALEDDGEGHDGMSFV